MNEKLGLFVSLDHNLSLVDLQNANYKGNGIEKKIINQYHCLESFGYKMEMFCPFASRIHIIHAFFRRLPLYWLRGFGNTYVRRALEFSFIYVRKPWFMDGNLIVFLWRLKQKNPNLKIIMEYPTYPPGKEANRMHMIPLVIKDKFWSYFIRFTASRVLTFSKDNIIDGVKTICTCNAINTELVRPISGIDNKIDEKVHLIACSSMAFWHGYDRMMAGILQFKNAKGSCPVVLHLVGDGEKLEEYKKFVLDNNLSDNIIIHGFLTGKELDEIYEIADIALDSMGRHRSRIYYNSSLKGKEYCAKGLPIISGVETELDADKKYKYYLRVPADDSPIEVNCVIDFYLNIYKGQQSRAEVIHSISEYAKNNFSYRVSMQPLADYINS